MTKGLEVGYQLDMTRVTVLVERQYVLSGDWICTGADRRMAGEVEGVFDVQLELVVFVGRQAIDQPEQRGQRGHFAARHVEHQSAVSQLWTIANCQRGDPPA